MKHPWPDYELIDFGDGRKLERFGQVVVDRPAPAAEGGRKSDPAAWTQAVGVYTGARVGDGKWKFAAGGPPSDATVHAPLADGCAFQMQLEYTPAGQVGLFPEQFENWRWIADWVGRGEQLRVLNLFGYAGGSTLAAAAAGAAVTHVDASKPSVALARKNAEASGLADAPIRWIVEDAVRYCQREVKRGNRYDAVVLDPPSFGHGPKGEQWKLTRDLPGLLGVIAELVEGRPKFLLATCHTPGIGPAEIGGYLADGVFGTCAQPASTGEHFLVARDGRPLESGVYARWPR
ncbi:Ribosomal RNA large subunit methyltransferase K [Posidoniimonas polymericola]|uniref:Ribosomal RNA large subunit methyltransferase K n=1 Tax=Posidoniimonas polymericola TaxID=2528002 RepID=A0A5C5YSW1_9BACT|nr:class I SAM-dependent methyltransferase [Posidoniimonas polymericola]TWT78049.1 Ribosomal RNA large subunit methyltransferase K [Posidoniimonas polymericola]